jgi:hypothetical protein
MQPQVVTKFIDLYGKQPTPWEYRQFEPYFFYVDFTSSTSTSLFSTSTSLSTAASGMPA